MKTVKVMLALVFIQAALCLGYLWFERDRARLEPSGATFAHAQADGREVPPLEFTRHDGSRGDLRSLRGKRTLVHFWATWCAPCIRELPALLAFARENRIKLLAVSLDSDFKKVEGFFDREVPREVVLAHRDAASALIGVETLPDTYLLDADGRVVQRLHGAQSWESPEAKAWLASIPPS
jgi:thiol-disulfide isomerase/thioredoxin